MTDKPIILLGGGGHAKVLLDVLKRSGRTVIGFTDPERTELTGAPYLGDDKAVLQFDSNAVLLVNGLGSTVSTERRASLYRKLHDAGYRFAAAVHPSAVIAEDVVLGDGVQIMAGAVIQPGCRLGANVIVNTRASVDHDCTVGNHVHIAPGAILSGGIHIGDAVHVGTGAVIIQNIRIGAGSLVGAGAVVVKDVSERTKVLGVPAREVN
ncbi:acetyltransferase [Paenibacillus sp.]|uniref:acetyltransferase n=1 Tax=Paenibacillus sp. TaxID=58172 RepID=UPI002D74D0C5|nr:acetyltransferase [Paenibacillus sp.]HZG87402.1 acetyltransferase [Paenibacillus sp.]